jgi:tripartite-type tricarboxylate transporter receptor subunit TctC
MIRRRSVVQTGLAAPLLATLGNSARAEPIDQPKFIFGFPAGSAGDICARRVAEKVGGTPYAKSAAVVENRPGAGGRIALDTLRTAPADGSVLVLTPFACTAIYPHVYSKLGYDMNRDFVPVAMASYMHHGLAAGPMVPASVTDVKGFLAWAKANPDKANYASPGAGSTPHFVGALLGLMNNVDMKHVPYRGSVPGVTDVVGGQIAAMVTPVGDFLANHKAGRLRILASSGKARMPFTPDVATFAEQGFGELTVEEWYGFFAPARTPGAVVAAASNAIQAALSDKSVIDGLGVVALIAKGSSPDELARAQRTELERWGPLVKRVGFTAES